jgi:hypothetical protein
LSNKTSEEKSATAEPRSPVWKHRIAFHKNRNVQVVLWPPGEYQGHPTNPNITIEEGAYNSQRKTWQNTRITITLDKLPNVIQDLEIAYAKALEIIEQGTTEGEVAQREMAKPTDPIEYLKLSILEIMKPSTVYPRYKVVELAKEKHDWADTVEIEQAFSQLLEEGKVRPKFKGLNLVGFTKP